MLASSSISLFYDLRTRGVDAEISPECVPESQADVDAGLELRVADSGFSSYVETIAIGVLLDLVVNEMALGGRLERILPFGDKLDEPIGQQFFDDLFRCFVKLGPPMEGKPGNEFCALLAQIAEDQWLAFRVVDSVRRRSRPASQSLDRP